MKVVAGEVLETGWEPTTPHGDTVLRRAVLALAEEREHTARDLGGRATRSAGVSMADAGSPSPFLNGAVLLRPMAAPGGEGLAEEVERFYASGSGNAALLFSAWPTPDLRGRGWELVGHPPLMLRPPGGAVPPAPAGLEVERAAGPQDLAAFEATLVEGYPLEELLPPRPGRLYRQDGAALGRLRCWVGRVAGRPVSVSAAWVADGLVDVVWVATLPAARGRGYGEALTWRAALTEPGLPAVLLAERRRPPRLPAHGVPPPAAVHPLAVPPAHLAAGLTGLAKSPIWWMLARTCAGSGVRGC